MYFINKKLLNFNKCINCNSRKMAQILRKCNGFLKMSKIFHYYVPEIINPIRFGNDILTLSVF